VYWARRGARTLYYLVSFSRGAGAEPCRSARCPRKILFSFIVSFSRGAGALPLPEREVSSQNPFSFILHHLRRKMKTNEVVLVWGTGKAPVLSSRKEKPKM